MMILSLGRKFISMVADIAISTNFLYTQICTPICIVCIEASLVTVAVSMQSIAKYTCNLVAVEHTILGPTSTWYTIQARFEQQIVYDDLSQSCSLNKEGKGHDIHAVNQALRQRRQGGMTRQHTGNSVQAEEQFKTVSIRLQAV